MVKKYILIFFLFLFFSCGNREPSKLRFFSIDTVTDIIIYDAVSSKKLEIIQQGIDSLLNDWDRRFSRDKEGSEVYKINHREHDTITVSDDLYSMLKLGTAYGESTQGLFDITVSPLKEFWKPSGEGDSLPDPADSIVRGVIDSLLQFVDYRKISLTENNQVAFANKNIDIDVGGIAKGVVINELKKYLVGQKLSNFLISAGGDIEVMGKKASGDSFRVGVQNPRGSGLVAIISVDSGSVVTSGDYERYRIAKSGARVHHIFDTRTGYSATENISVTIVAPSPIIADILSTALFPLPHTEIIDYINKRPSLEGMVVDSAGESYYSKGFINEIK